MSKQILSGNQGLIKKVTQNSQNYLLSYHTIFLSKDTNLFPFTLIYKTPYQTIFLSVKILVILTIIITIISIIIVVTIGILILRRIVVSALDTTTFVASFSNQVLATIDQQERVVNQQSVSVQETTITMEELNISSQESANQANSSLTGAKAALSLYRFTLSQKSEVRSDILLTSNLNFTVISVDSFTSLVTNYL